MKVANKKNMPNIVVGSVVLAGLICTLLSLQKWPFSSFIVVMILYFTLIAFDGGRSGTLAAFTGGVSQGRLVQVTEHSYTNVQAVMHLPLGIQVRLNTKQKPHQNPALGTWLTEPGLEITT